MRGACQTKESAEKVKRNWLLRSLCMLNVEGRGCGSHTRPWTFDMTPLFSEVVQATSYSGAKR